MKWKKYKSIHRHFLLTILLAAIAFSLFGVGTVCFGVHAEDQKVSFVVDRVGILSDAECNRLNELAQQKSEELHCNLYMYIVEDYYDYNAAGSYDAAETIYRDENLGYSDESHSGMILMLSMVDRDYALVAFGTADQRMSDYGFHYIKDRFLDDFKEDEWADGFEDYLLTSEKVLTEAADGKKFDLQSQPQVRVGGVLISLILAVLAALLVCSILKSKMRSVVCHKEARDYLVPGTAEITQRNEVLVNRTCFRQKIEKSSGGGGGVQHRGGSSGVSGKF